MACWNGPRCCACSRPRTATRAIRRIGIEIGLGTCAYSANRVEHRTSARRGACFGRFAHYQEYDQGAYLPYVNAPGPSADIIASPLLRVSFGGRSYAAVMDTGSTGVVVSADKIPNIASLQSLGPGQLTYSSSGRIMIG